VDLFAALNTATGTVIGRLSHNWTLVPSTVDARWTHSPSRLSSDELAKHHQMRSWCPPSPT
jgi:hypothetical protein